MSLHVACSGILAKEHWSIQESKAVLQGYTARWRCRGNEASQDTVDIGHSWDFAVILQNLTRTA